MVYNSLAAGVIKMSCVLVLGWFGPRSGSMGGEDYWGFKSGSWVLTRGSRPPRRWPGPFLPSAVPTSSDI